MREITFEEIAALVERLCVRANTILPPELGILLELTWLKDHPQPYDLGEGEYHLGIVADDFEAAHKKHEEMGCICFENHALGVYFIEDPDGYWLEILPKRG